MAGVSRMIELTRASKDLFVVGTEQMTLLALQINPRHNYKGHRRPKQFAAEVIIYLWRGATNQRISHSITLAWAIEYLKMLGFDDRIEEFAQAAAEIGWEDIGPAASQERMF